MVSYQKFIRSPYWQTVRRHVIEQKGNKCSECETIEGLHVHHLTYQHHGQEHLYWQSDLIILCGDCHLNHHQVERARLHGPYPAEIIRVPDEPSKAVVLTLSRLKAEARKKNVKLPQLIVSYFKEGYAWADDDLPGTQRGKTQVLVKLCG